MYDRWKAPREQANTGRMPWALQGGCALLVCRKDVFLVTLRWLSYKQWPPGVTEADAGRAASLPGLRRSSSGRTHSHSTRPSLDVL